MAGPRRGLGGGCIPVACRHTIHLVDTVRRAHSMERSDAEIIAHLGSVVRELLAEVEASRKKLAAVRALLDHEDTAGHRLVPDDSRMESDGLGILETWQVRYVLDGTMP